MNAISKGENVLSADFRSISDEQLLSDTRRLVGRSNVVSAMLLAHLSEVEARGVHRLRACSSLYTYCIYELRLSEDEAFRRVSAARWVRRFPRLLDCVASGELHLTGLLMIAPHLTTQNLDEVLARAKHRTKKELARLVRELDPLPPVPALIEPLGPARTLLAPANPGWERVMRAMYPVRDFAPGDRPRDWTDEANPTPALPSLAQVLGSEPLGDTQTESAPGRAEGLELTDEMHTDSALARLVTGRLAANAGSEPCTGSALARLVTGRSANAGSEPCTDSALARLVTGRSANADLDLCTDSAPARADTGRPTANAGSELCTDSALARADTGRPTANAGSELCADSALARVDNSEAVDDGHGKCGANAGHGTPGRDRRGTTGARYKVQFTASEEYVELVERARELLSSRASTTELEEIHLQAMRALVNELEKRRGLVPTHRAGNGSEQAWRETTSQGDGQEDARTRKRSRAVPARVRREVIERDGRRCTYVNEQGQRCQETTWLELHHLRAFARGGAHTACNLVVRCHAHNALAAEDEFGTNEVRQKREHATAHLSLARVRDETTR